MTRFGYKDRFHGPCPRCDVDAKERRHPLCTDCRLLLNKYEAAQWLPTPRCSANDTSPADELELAN